MAALANSGEKDTDSCRPSHTRSLGELRCNRGGHLMCYSELQQQPITLACWSWMPIITKSFFGGESLRGGSRYAGRYGYKARGAKTCLMVKWLGKWKTTKGHRVLQMILHEQQKFADYSLYQLLAGSSILQYSPSRTHRGRLRTKPIHFQPQLLIRRRSPTYLPNILVPNSADLLNVCGTLWNVLQRITVELYLILLILGNLYINTWVHGDLANNLLPDEISKVVRSKSTPGRGRGIPEGFPLKTPCFQRTECQPRKAHSPNSSRYWHLWENGHRHIASYTWSPS